MNFYIGILLAGIGIAVAFGCGETADSAYRPGINQSTKSCTVVRNVSGISIISCPDGSSATVLDGTPGANGLNGVSGTSITTVQFCPGSVTNYPSTFAEVGFCIGGNLFAVYSANDGFLTEIVPGAYNSNAIGSSCNFTVLPGCGIQ